MSKRRTHRPEFKARVAMEAISGRKTIQKIAAQHAIHPIQVSQWKKQLLEGVSDLFTGCCPSIKLKMATGATWL
jgi:putative transposase